VVAVQPNLQPKESPGAPATLLTMPRKYSSRDLCTYMNAINDFIEVADQYQADRSNDRLRAQVAVAAGRCQGATAIAGMYHRHREPPASGGRSVTFDPILNWNAEIDPFTDSLLVALESAHQIAGYLAGAIKDAEREERSLVGRVARVVGFSARVRQYLSERGYPLAVQRAGVLITAAGQMLVAAAGTLLGTLLFTLLWQRLVGGP